MDLLTTIDYNKTNSSYHPDIRLSCPHSHDFLVVVYIDVHEWNSSVAKLANMNLSFSLSVVQDQSVYMCTTRMDLAHLN